MSAAPFRVMIARHALDASSPEMKAAIERQNERQRLPGLDDELNPRIVDPAKFEALVHAVGAEAAQKLRGRPLFLDPVALRIAASSPTRPEAFAGRVHFKTGEKIGESISASVDASYDCALARERAAAARRRTEEAAKQVDAMDVQKQPAAVPRQVRYRAALAWRENAEVASGCAPQDEAAKAEALAAAKAATDYQLLGGSME
jgi:hypothetical protein